MYLLYWLISIMPLETHWLWGHVLFGTFTLIKALGLLCLVVACCRFVTSRHPLTIFYSGSGGWFLAFISILCLAAIHSLPQSSSQAWSQIFSILSLFIIVVVLVNTRRKLNNTLLVGIGAAGLASIYTIRLQRYYGAGYRGGGLSLDSNYYAMLVGLWMPLAFVWSLSRRPRRERLFCGCCFLVMLAGSGIAASRGGFLGLAAAFLYVIFRSQYRVRNFMLACAFGVPLLALAQPSLLQRFLRPDTGDRFGEQARLIAWKSGLRMVETHPLMGVGLGNFENVILQYEDPAWLTAMKNYLPIVNLAHNTYIELAAEAGLPGLLSFVLLLLMTFRRLEEDRRRAERARSAHSAAVALGLQAGLLSFAVSAAFLTAWWEKMVWLLIFLPMCNRLTMSPKRRARIEGLSVISDKQSATSEVRVGESADMLGISVSRLAARVEALEFCPKPGNVEDNCY